MLEEKKYKLRRKAVKKCQEKGITPNKNNILEEFQKLRYEYENKRTKELFDKEAKDISLAEKMLMEDIGKNLPVGMTKCEILGLSGNCPQNYSKCPAKTKENLDCKK